MSATPDSTLANPEQRIADLERQLAEAREQQAATAEVLGVINSSPGDVAPVFDAMLEKAMHLCGASFGLLTRIEGDSFRVVASHGAPPACAELFRQPQRIVPGQAHHRLMQGADVAHVEDITTEDVYRSGDPAARALADLAGARSGLCVSLRKEGTLLGTIIIYRREVRPFSDKQIALLQNFAAQAVIAMENARLLTETREALDQQTATAEVLQVINSSPGDLAPVFEAVLEKAHRLCDASFGRLLIRDGDVFRLAAAHGEPRFVEAAQQLELERPSESGVLVRLERGEPIVVADVRADDSYHTAAPPLRSLIDASGVRTSLTVPLLKDGAVLGVITASRREVRPFTDKQIALLQNFAAQAVIAMENARLLTETREALEQQTATAEVLGVINSSPGDLAPVFDAMLEKALSLCEASFGIMNTYEGERLLRVAERGLAPAYNKWREANPLGSSSAGNPVALQRLIGGERAVHIGDLRTSEMYHASNPNTCALVDLAGARTHLAVALRRGHTVCGMFTIFRQEVRLFTDKQIALLQNFAAQAVIAMENARLLTETREALEQQTATAEVLQVINSSPGDLKPVFDAILEKAHSLCGVAQGSLELYDGQNFRAVATHGLADSFADQLRQGYPASDNPATRPLIEGQPFSQILDVTQHEFPFARDRGNARTLLCVPLRRDDKLLGMIACAPGEVRPYTDKEIALLQNFAAQAVIAMENARLLIELRQRTEEVAELNRGLEARVAEQVDELGRVGRLKRFLAPQLAELIVSHGDEKILESHRRDIVVVFCDLRGYTAFTETAEPEEVLDFLREYHGALGPLVSQYEGTLDQFSGDGIMVFFNDPVPCPDPAERAVKMAMAMREAAGKLIAGWRERGRDLGFGAGIAQGYATLGQIGFSERSGYTAIGTVCNVAARLCAEAKDGQILLSQRVNLALMGSVATEQLGPLTLKGLTQPVVAYNVPLAAIQPALRVIEGGPQSV
jgi:GAF domain-containing protein